MKIKTCLVSGITLLFLGALWAQDTPAPSAASAPASTAATAGRGAGPASTTANSPSAAANSRQSVPEGVRLPENLTLTIKGTLSTGIDVNLTCTTAGPRFTMNYIMSKMEINGVEQPIIGNCQASITPENGAYRIDYGITISRPIVSSSTTSVANRGAAGNNVTSTITYSSTGLTSSVLLKLDQAVSTSSNSDGQNLTFTLTKP